MSALVMWAILGFMVTATIVVWGLNRRAMTVRQWASDRNCLFCGYDLRESVSRCPECGWEPLRRLDTMKLRRLPQSQANVIFGAAPLDVAVHLTVDKNEARLLILQLAARGVAAVRADAEFPGRRMLVLFRVCVAPTDAPRASELVRELASDVPVVEGSSAA